MSRELNPSQIWSQLPVASRTVEVNTKTGFSLTAGSYSVLASSTQRGTITEAQGGGSSATAAIAPVTVTRALASYEGAHETGIAALDFSMFGRITLTNATTVTLTRSDNNSCSLIADFQVHELF